MWAYVYLWSVYLLPCLWGMVVACLVGSCLSVVPVSGRCPLPSFRGGSVCLFVFRVAFFGSLYCSLFVGALPFLEINS